MERYSVIHTKMPREFVLLQGGGCRWRRCTFCDYHKDTSATPYAINKEILSLVTGCYGILDIINSGSGTELDADTLQLIKKVAEEKNIHTLWFEMHYMYRHRLDEFARYFAPLAVKFRCGIESFDPEQRKKWNKGVPTKVTAEDVAKYFQGVCLLCGTEGESRERIISDIQKAEEIFEYYSINLFCNNSTEVKRDESLAEWFINNIYPTANLSTKAEILLNNTDLGVGD